MCIIPEAGDVFGTSLCQLYRVIVGLLQCYQIYSPSNSCKQSFILETSPPDLFIHYESQLKALLVILKDINTDGTI